MIGKRPFFFSFVFAFSLPSNPRRLLGLARSAAQCVLFDGVVVRQHPCYVACTSLACSMLMRLSTANRMPPVDAIYRPHVVHQTLVTPEAQAQQSRSKTKRYFAAE